MKLFDYWTELPSALTALFPELSENLINFSFKLKATTELITSNQSNINDNLCLLEYSDLMIDCKHLLKEKVASIEKEKRLVLIECVKLTSRMIKEGIEVLSRLNKEEPEFIIRSNLFLKMTRLIKDKVNEEINSLNEQLSCISKNDSLYNECAEEKKFLQTVEVFIEKNQLKLIDICSFQKKCTNSEFMSNNLEKDDKDDLLDEKNCFLKRKTSSRSSFSESPIKPKKTLSKIKTKFSLESMQSISNHSLSTKMSGESSDEEVLERKETRNSYNYLERSEFKLSKL